MVNERNVFLCLPSLFIPSQTKKRKKKLEKTIIRQSGVREKEGIIED